MQQERAQVSNKNTGKIYVMQKFNYLYHGKPHTMLISLTMLYFSTIGYFDTCFCVQFISMKIHHVNRAYFAQ